MSKNRRIPFGYMMQNGIITTNPAEVLAVLTIFSEYMAGKSFLSIAINMKVPYSENKIWNKNMVKRVLENEKYLGTDVYPQLISEEVFRKVNERKSAKATSLCIIPDELQEIRNLTVCKECGKRLFRTKAELWDCRNNECRPFLFKMTDEMLTGAILNILNTVIANSMLIEAEAAVSEYISTSEIHCKQSEIDRAIDNGTKTAEEIRNDILRLAELKYKHCTYSDVNQKTELLKSLIDSRNQLNTLDIGLLRSCIKRIWRCINRLEHGPKYCKSPTIDEEPLHNAIVRAINEFYNCSDDVANILKSAADAVLSGSNDNEIKQIEQRLKDIDQARNDFVNLIATGACAPNSLDDEFARLYSEEEKLSQKLLSLKAQANTESNGLSDEIKADIDNSNFELRQYDDVLVRKIVECVKILNKEEISVTFKGGYEIKSELLT